MKPEYELTLYFGAFIHLPRLPEGQSRDKPKPQLVRNHGLLWVSANDGRIEGFDWDAQHYTTVQALMARKGWVDINNPETNGNNIDGKQTMVKLVSTSTDQNEFFFPGFIDTHIHAPQYPNSGLFGSTTLLDWLEEYTFPMESSFGTHDKKDSRDPKDTPSNSLRIYDQVVARTLSHGTTCASYFATIHIAATNALARLCYNRGQRAFIGRVCMDNPDFCPSYYRDDSAEESLTATEATIEYIQAMDPEGTLVKPIVTPRFVPTCTRPSLENLGKLAASYTPPLHIQTHISENINEVALVKELFPESSSYAGVYDTYNLLTPRTILAHAVHLTADERRLILERDAKISHCPASNSALGSGIAPVRTFLDEGMTVGLGTDVSGGYSPSILEAARQACLASRLLGHTTAFAKKENHHQCNGNAQGKAGAKDETGREKLSVEESLYLATRGGAAVIDMADDLGGFDVGMIFDAQLIQLGCVSQENPETLLDERAGKNLVRPGTVSNVDIFSTEKWEERVHKWVWGGDDRNVKAVWVGGKLVHERD
ncbi:guanine deaminase [Penicillium pulvis]|uniref:guanine deaminase n=1 Tax=Penicillium pulvis TaxID=1562058 RepID=UPI0025472858|nr:guanine deaminase [Penicillium pulvis]KAJ5798441.1 guanine deaminase [Penicillium pulvis]